MIEAPPVRHPTVHQGPPRRRWIGAVDGMVAGLLTIGVGTILAGGAEQLGLTGGQPAPIAAVAGAFIDRTPPWLKDFAVSTFGTNDKRALLIGTLVVLALVCAALGLLARTRITAGLLGFAVVGAIGIGAVLSRPGAVAFDVVPTLLGTIVGLWFLRAAVAQGPDPAAGLSRRWIIGGVVGAAGAYLGNALAGGSNAATASRVAAQVPAVPLNVATRVTIPAGADLKVAGVAPFVSDTAGFYRIDTAFVVPRLNADEWRLNVTGMVDREVQLDWATLQSKELQEAMVTLCCVSNEVGGDLIGNAVWTGWPVRELLKLAGPKAGADMVLQTSTDGWTCGTPLGALTDDRDALLAVRMNGQPLPFEHGFPVRLVVPGLYGYVSACKWVTELKVTTFADDAGYWTPRGWSELGPVKTASRIDVPHAGGSVSSGTVAVAGVAWAQHRGISRVEVQVDDAPWVEARLAADAGIDVWRQWVFEWEATRGSHDLRVRAVDGTGALQTPVEASPAPDGASGYHSVTVRVD
ncbi:MAG: molybdopterin-dependent oxidoreductase [Dermatophilaceae bacterium]